MTAPQRPGQHVGRGFVVISEATRDSPGIVRCGGCEKTMSNNSLAREAHARGCPELLRLRAAADRAYDQARRAFR